jgi:outer membrane protein TolC
MKGVIPYFIACSLITLPVFGQVKTVSLDSAISIAHSNNKNLQAVSAQTEYYQYQKKASTELPKTDVTLTYGQYNSFYKQDNNITVAQTFPFPTVFSAKSSLANAQLKGAALQVASTKNELSYQIKQVYYQLLFWDRYKQMLQNQDSSYNQLAKGAALRYKTGDGTLLDKTSAETRLSETRNTTAQVDAQILGLNSQLQSLMGVTYAVQIQTSDSLIRPFTMLNDSAAVAANPQLAYIRQQIEIAEKEKSVIAQSALPEFKIGYFNQTLYGTPLDATGSQIAGPNNRFQGIQVGLVFPLWFYPQVNSAKAAETQVEIAELNYQSEQIMYQSLYDQAIQRYLAAQSNLTYYQTSALPNATLIESQSKLSYANGDIGYTQHLLNLQQAIAIQEAYLSAVNEYNQTVIYLEYLTAR